MGQERKNVIRKKATVFTAEAFRVWDSASAEISIWLSASFGAHEASRNFSIEDAERVVEIIKHEIKRAKKMNKKKEGK